MIRFKTRRAGSGKRGRICHKFPRGTKLFKNFDGTHLRMRYYYGWRGPYVTAENLDRFLLANVGRPVDKVYSEFLKRCDSSIQDPKHEFFGEFEKKEDIIPRWGGFYITNGIINYKKRRKSTYSKTMPSYSEINNQNMPDRKKLVEVCEQSKNTMRATFLGRFYVYDRWYNSKLVSIFVQPVGALTWPSRRVAIIGVGVGINLHKETWGYKSRTQAYFMRYDIHSESGIDAYEFIVKEK